MADDGNDDELDCLVIGAGPAGLTAGLYLARFHRRFAIIDAGASRAEIIPESHNIPVFADGISGHDLIARMRTHLERYEARIMTAEVQHLTRLNDGFSARIGETFLRARRVILCTGAVDIEPDLPGLDNAVQRGIVRYCPICDGYEAAGQRIAVIGGRASSFREALFIARTYSSDVTVLALGRAESIDDKLRTDLGAAGVRLVFDAVRHAALGDGRGVTVMLATGETLGFDTAYSALGLAIRSQLAIDLGAEHDENRALTIDAHNQTSVPGLFAAGGVVRGLDQIVVAMGHASVAATAVHNASEQPAIARRS